MVLAVGIEHDASSAALELARAVQAAATAKGVHVPLLRYNRYHAGRHPFDMPSEDTIWLHQTIQSELAIVRQRFVRAAKRK